MKLYVWYLEKNFIFTFRTNRTCEKAWRICVLISQLLKNINFSYKLHISNRRIYFVNYRVTIKNLNTTELLFVIGIFFFFSSFFFFVVHAWTFCVLNSSCLLVSLMGLKLFGKFFVRVFSVVAIIGTLEKENSKMKEKLWRFIGTCMWPNSPVSSILFFFFSKVIMFLRCQWEAFNVFAKINLSSRVEKYRFFKYLYDF